MKRDEYTSVLQNNNLAHLESALLLGLLSGVTEEFESDAHILQ